MADLDNMFRGIANQYLKAIYTNDIFISRYICLRISEIVDNCFFSY